jgi:four helix bundle protein
MATFKSFEDIEAWIEARSLTRQIYQMSLKQPFCKDYTLCNQIRGASISIMSNIAEGFERDGSKEFVQFLSIAKGSVGEVRSQLYIALDQNYITKDQFNSLYELTIKVATKLSRLISYLKTTNIKGQKYKNLKPET